MRRILTSLVVVLSLGACGANRLRLETAAEVSEAADSVVSGSNEAIAAARARQIESSVALVASDPSCLPTANIQVWEQGSKWSPKSKRPPLCVEYVNGKPRMAYPGYIASADNIDLRPVATNSLKPTMLMIAAVGDYGAALSKIVERPKTDIAKELGDIAAKADAAGALANAIAGSNVPELTKALASDQAKAALALAQFASELSEEAAQVRDVRALVAENDAEIKKIIPQLQHQLNRWIDIYGKGSSQEIVNSLNRSYEKERHKLNYEQRVVRVRQVMDARNEIAAWENKKAVISSTLDDLAEAEDKLVRHLLGDFTKEERATIARYNADRIVNGLKLITSVITSIGGL